MKTEIQKKAVNQYGTPLYLYDIKRIKYNIQKLCTHLIPGCGLYFSMKANPLRYLCKIAYQSGCGIEIASDGELRIATQAGVSPENIVFTGPGKTMCELEQTICAGIYMINVESIQEVREIQKIAKKQIKLYLLQFVLIPVGEKQKAKFR